MSTQMVTPKSGALSAGQRRWLFIASCLALAATALVFSIRAAIMDDLGASFHVDKELVGIFAGEAFLGFAAAILVGGPLCDALGMRAYARRSRVEQRPGLRARHAVRNQRKSAGNSVHLLSPPP